MSFNGILLVSFTAGFLIENLMFARGFGIDGLLNHTQNTTRILVFGLYTYTTAIPACSLAWLIKNRGDLSAVPTAVQPMIWLICLCLVYFVHLLVIKKMGTKRNINTDLLQIAAFSCAAFGTMLLALMKNASFFSTLLYANGCIVGLLASMLLVHYGRERIRLSHVPAAFEGLPILLVYAGILSMAIYGLVGYQLPAA
jgi:electron transport complex protein RnfA